jgi:alcohol dehydrogenase class IV
MPFQKENNRRDMQKIIQGEHTIQRVGEEIREKGYSMVFLVTGKHLEETFTTDLLKGMAVQHFIKAGPNVGEEEINKAYTAFKRKTYPVILAIGGGSVIDLAKSVIHHCLQASSFIPFFIAAPTTAGSGSEATHFAVLYKGAQKISLVDPFLLPSVVILDPELLYSLSGYQTAVTGMDVISQAVESYWNRNAVAASRKDAVEAITLWKEYFMPAVQGSGHAKGGMLLAAHKAGKAINITRTTGPHALSYFLTAKHGVQHGQAVALFLPVFFLYNDPDKALYELLGVGNKEKASEYIREIMKQAGLATTFAELNINKEIILDELLDSVNEERFANNPMPFDRERLKELFITHL